MSSESTNETPADRRKRVAAAFKNALGSGLSLRIEDFLGLVPQNERIDLLAKLVQLDYRFRWDKGLCPTVAEYRSRFSEHVQRLKDELFNSPEQGSLPYILINKLDQGGFGTVYRARDTKFQRDVAVKVLNPKSLQSAKAVTSFDREIMTLVSLTHPNIVQVYDKGCFEDGQRFVVMKYIDGRSLREVIKDHPSGIEPIWAAEIISETAKAVHFMHEHLSNRSALVHLDLKPENILLDGNGKPYVADVGLAAFVTDLHGSRDPVGLTLPYASPEQVFSSQNAPNRVGRRSDIWSLGVVLYELLTGKRPFLGTKKEVMEWIVSYEPDPVSDLNTAVPTKLDMITRKCLDKDPNERFETAQKLANELDEWVRTFKATPDPSNFSLFLNEKRRYFSDRPWLFEEVDAWRAHGSEAVLLITGDFGTGKSAFLAELIHRNAGGRVLAHHCCQRDTPDTRRSAHFVRSLAGMISAKCEAYRQALSDPAVRESLSEQTCEADPASSFERGILTPLENVQSQGDDVRYIVIDALDESIGVGRPSISELLSSRVNRLPRWLRIIATTRREPEILESLSGVRTLAIDCENSGHSDDILEDLRRYIMARLEEPNFAERLHQAHVSPEDAATTLLKKSESNYLYVATALEGIEIGQVYGFDRLHELPPGLDRLYKHFLERHFPNNESFKHARDIFEVVRAAEEPPTDQLLAVAAGLDADYQLPEMLDKLAVYLKPRTTNGATQYHFVHTALADWLVEPNRAGRFHVSLKKGHERLATACGKEYEQGLEFLSEYSLRHLPSHLTECKRWKFLEKLLTDFRYLSTKAEAGFVIEIADDLGSAVSCLPKHAGGLNSLRVFHAIVRGELPFLSRHPRALFQTLWNYGYWYDTPELSKYLEQAGAQTSEGISSKEDKRPRVCTILERWHDSNIVKETNWLRSLRPPHLPIDLAVRLLPHFDEISAAAFSSDSSRIAVAAGTHLHLWDRKTGLQTGTPISLQNSRVRSIAFVSSAAEIAVGYEDGRISVIDISSGRERVALSIQEGRLVDLVLSPDGKYLAVGTVLRATDALLLSGRIYVWNLKNLELLSDPVDLTLRLLKLKFSPDSQALAMLMRGTTLRRLRVPVGFTAQVRTLLELSDTLWSKEVNPATVEKTDRLRAIVVIPEHQQYPVSLSFPTETKLLAVFLRPEQNMLWDAWTGEELEPPPFETRWVSRGEISQDEMSFMSSWNLFEPSEDRVRLLALSPNCRYELHRRTSRIAEVINLESSGIKYISTGSVGQQARVVGMWELPNRRLITQSALKVFRIWDTECGRPVKSARVESEIRKWECSNDGAHLIVDTVSSHLTCWTILGNGDREPRWSLTDAAMPTEGPVFVDNEHALVFREGQPCIIELLRGQIVDKLPAASTNSLCTALAANANLIAVGSADGSVRIWNIRERRGVAQLSGHGDGVRMLKFAPDAKTIISASGDGFVRVWDVATETRMHSWQTELERIDLLEAAFEMDRLIVVGPGSYPTEEGRAILFSLDGTCVGRFDCLSGVYRSQAPGVGPPIFEVCVFSKSEKEVAIQASTSAVLVDSVTGHIKGAVPGLGALHEVANGHLPAWRIRLGNGDLTVLSMATGEEIAWFPRPSRAALILRDGKTIATAHARDGRLELLRLECASHQ